MIFKRRAFSGILLVIVGGLLVAACGDMVSSPPATPPLNFGQVTAGSKTSVANADLTPAATVGYPQVAPATPIVGANGQITVVASAATGEVLPGSFFWTRDNNVWQGGAGVPPLSAKNLGGKKFTNATPLAIARAPAISPNGAWLAYAFSPEPEGTAGNFVIGQDIYSIDLKTNKNTLLVQRDTPQTFLDNPYFSADGKFIYFDSRTPRTDNRGQIVGEVLAINRLELATNKREQIAEDAREPVPLPDGKQIAYIGINASQGSYEQTLRLYDLDSRKSRPLLQVAQGFIASYNPRPSPDGQWIVFSAAGGPDNVFNPNGGSVPLTPPPLPTRSATGNSAGKPLYMPVQSGSLAALAMHGVPFDLWLIKPDGSSLKRLTTLYEDQPQSAWSRDGKTIAFLGGQGFYTINLDGTNLVRRSEMGAHGGFAWRD